ncbi:MAG: 4-hydroxy-2-oxovalerate aldolase [Candidatus Thorarchaeota archaeon]|nr:4-hydroxy-2-oxovalerate aldolase [Candidatus Thorarchaeota archaeon]
MRFEIMEVTLRDGSYIIDFGFDSVITTAMVSELDRIGFEKIEIGHGLGLGARGLKHGVSLCTDEEYLEAAAKGIRNAEFGTFLIPGIGSKNDLEIAASYGMGFVRIGTNITQAALAAPYVRFAQSLGMTVTNNLMKSYIVEEEKMVEYARLCLDFGTDIVYIVDSAGGMYPEEVRSIISNLKNSLDCKIGFHGHNNLGLAAVNSLVALEAGADIVDASMNGMGRSAGNAQTEILVAILAEKDPKYHDMLLDLLELVDRYVTPIMPKPQGINTRDVWVGHSLLHSSYLSTIERAAWRYGVSVSKMIAEVGRMKLASLTEDMALDVARRLRKE